MSRINTNVPALKSIHQMQKNQIDLSIRLQRLSTGLRINRGADDPAGLIASERLRSEIRGIEQAIDNSTRANNVISVAEGALNEASALLLDLQALVVSTSNTGGLTNEEEEANQLQIDSILASLDRISATTTFAGRKLLDGTRAYLTSGVPPAAIPTAELYSALVPNGTTRSVTVKVTQSALTAQIGLVGTNTTGTSTTSGTTIEIRGTLGTSVLSFASGTSLSDVRATINGVASITGVSATVSSTGITGVASALVLQSTAVGVDAFVSVSPINGNFVEASTSGTVRRAVGREAIVLINGRSATMNGLRADVRSQTLDARLRLTRAFAQTLSSATFGITGGGALFQLTSQINPSGQSYVGFNSIATTQLGNSDDGLLFSLGSGRDNSLASGNFETAQKIVNASISEIATYRGRLGDLQRNEIEPNINSQRVALENVTASESIIRDADIATEVSALTRAQILVQTTQSALQIANTLPNLVLSLLG